MSAENGHQFRDFVDFLKGKPPRETFDTQVDGSVPYLSPEYLRGDARPLFVRPFNSAVHVAGGEILLLWDGSNAGEVFVAKEGILASTMAVLRPRHDNTDRDYLGFCLKLHEERLKAFTAGSGIPHVDKAIVKRLPLFKPPLEKQKDIAALLKRVDEAIASAQVSILKTEQFQKAFARELLSGRLKPDGRVTQDQDFWTHHKAGLVPRGWCVAPLSSLAEIQRGKFSHRPRNEPRFFGGCHPFIQTGDISNSRGYIVSHQQTLSEEGTRISRLFPKGTVCVSIVGVNVAATAIASYDVYAPDSVIGLIPRGQIVSEYLEFFLRSRRNKLAAFAGDSARENLNYGILRPLLIAYPKDIEEQRHIAKNLCNCESLIRTKERKISALLMLKKSLMRHLLTGKIRLPVPAKIPAPTPT